MDGGWVHPSLSGRHHRSLRERVRKAKFFAKGKCDFNIYTDLMDNNFMLTYGCWPERSILLYKGIVVRAQNVDEGLPVWQDVVRSWCSDDGSLPKSPRHGPEKRQC